MKTRILLLAAVLFFSGKLFCQQPDTLIHKLDSLNKKTDTTGQKNIINPKAYTENTKISFSYDVKLKLLRQYMTNHLFNKMDHSVESEIQ